MRLDSFLAILFQQNSNRLFSLKEALKSNILFINTTTMKPLKTNKKKPVTNAKKFLIPRFY